MELLRLPQNQGKAEAVRLGFRAAFEKSPWYLGYWDADLSTPLEALSSFETVFEELPAVEMVFGSRVMLLGRDVVRERYRHYFGRAFASLASAILRLPIYDTQCGAKLFRNTETLGEIFSSPFESKWVFDIEILARLETLRSRTAGPPPQTVRLRARPRAVASRRQLQDRAEPLAARGDRSRAHLSGAQSRAAPVTSGAVDLRFQLFVLHWLSSWAMRTPSRTRSG